MTISLFILAMIGPEITQIDTARFEVRIRFDDLGPSGNANAQMALFKAATKHCKGRGKAVSEGTLELNNTSPIKKKRTLELKERYSCVTNQKEN